MRTLPSAFAYSLSEVIELPLSFIFASTVISGSSGFTVVVAVVTVVVGVVVCVVFVVVSEVPF